MDFHRSGYKVIFASTRITTTYTSSDSFPHFQICLRQDYDHRQNLGWRTQYFLFLSTLVLEKHTKLLENIAGNSSFMYYQLDADDLIDHLLVCHEVPARQNSRKHVRPNTKPTFLVWTENVWIDNCSITVRGTFKGDVKIKHLHAQRTLTDPCPKMACM